MSVMKICEAVAKAASTQIGEGTARAQRAASVVLQHAELDLRGHRGVIGWLIIGLLAGWLSGEVVRGKGFGCLGNILLGLIGAVVGGWLFEQLHISTFGFIGGLAAATVGAVAIVALARALAGSD